MGPMGPTGPYSVNGYDYLLYVFLVVIFLAVFILSVYFLRTRQRDPESRKYSENGHQSKSPIVAESNSYGDRLEVTLRLLNDNERSVVEAIVANGGSILQKDITIDLGFSRVKTHRVLQGLVKRDIITLEDYHNTNKVTLADWLLKESELGD